jgi:hypothetical protein
MFIKEVQSITSHITQSFTYYKYVSSPLIQGREKIDDQFCWTKSDSPVYKIEQSSFFRQNRTEQKGAKLLSFN